MELVARDLKASGLDHRPGAVSFAGIEYDILAPRPSAHDQIAIYDTYR
jgi:hypothetical protein